ncbi:hypothetical protein T265_04880 [Opisthorchis viverrini]|uniref:Uncharacterized protein n=1 Tax=Opisthorchis viverrini TaxID=6198 RepID=A0A074ZR42_OPIVI|nr:hypothetical protein T265_04880 [Opisthorchis viverrini]KER28282.1 hypothetical protein T265_04880 [Opisthorchis viverrini]
MDPIMEDSLPASNVCGAEVLPGRRRDISLSVKGRVFNAAVRSILLYGSETWPLRAEDVKRLSLFDHRCLRSITRIWWEHRISNSEVRRMVFGRNNSPSIDELITLHRVEESQRRSNNGLAAKYESHYQQTQLRWSLPSSWMRTPRRATSMSRDMVRHGPVAPSMALVHPSYYLQCIAPFPIPPLDSPLTVLDLSTNLSSPACNAQLPTPSPNHR